MKRSVINVKRFCTESENGFATFIIITVPSGDGISICRAFQAYDVNRYLKLLFGDPGSI